MAKIHTINIRRNGGAAQVLMQSRKIFVPVTEEWLESLDTVDLWQIMELLDIDPNDFEGKNTHKKLRRLILENQ